MKSLKKMMAIVIAMVMTLSMTVAAFASGATPTPGATAETTYEISGGKENHEYTVWQLFTGDLSDDGTTLSNLKWPSGTEFTEDEVADLKTLVEGLEGKSEVDIANAMYDAYYATAANMGTLDSADASIDELPAGYYLIEDTTAELADGEARSLYVLKVVNDVDFSPKTGTTQSEKKLDDINDSTGDAELLQDSADYDIGDDVPYTLTATLAENVHDYQKYHITFIDELESGKLKNNKDYVFVIDNVEYAPDELPDGWGYSLDDESDDGFEITLEWDAGANKQLNAENNWNLDSKVITLKFTAELLEGANIGAQGNINEFHLEYSNNPNNRDGSEVGETPVDTVIVFTYKIVVNKVDENGDDLNGAAFSLYKQYADEDAVPDGATACEEDGYDDYYLVKALTTSEGSEFEFVGIDDGNYLLVETETPDGYNSIKPIEITVEAAHVSEIEGFDAAKRVYGDQGYLTSLEGAGENDTIELEFTVDEDNDEALTADVINHSGVELPSTGGIGTTIFYIVGTILVIGAGVLLVTRRRMSAQ